MTTKTAPSFSQIKAQVAAIRQKVPQARVIGIRSLERWTGQALQHDGAHEYAIHQCDSPLEFRLALRQPASDEVTKVLITGLEESELGDDVLLRLARRRLHAIDTWQIVRSLFEAQTIDPRLTRQPWIAEMLLELVSPQGYPAARGGFLDAETVWPILLRQAIQLATDAPDLHALLAWSLDPAATAGFRRCSHAFRQGAIEWLAEKAGPVVDVLLPCIERLDRPDAVPLGLAASVVYHRAAAGKLEKATGKLEERFFGGQSPAAEQMRRWGTAATEVVRSLRQAEPKLYRQTIQRADEILRELQAESMAYLSETSPWGFDQRLARFGEQLSSVVEQAAWGSLDSLSEVRQQLFRHDLAAEEKRRLERVDMALRLVRWQESHSGAEAIEPTSFPEAAELHLREGGWVDWARLSLRSGDPVRTLSEAYARLFENVRQVREQQSKAFAKLLADWTAAGSKGNEVVPVERALDEIVAPLAADRQVLVIVIDGMSVAVCRELLADITRHEWIPISEPGRSFNRPGLATIPSVTEFARTSLLCGQPCQGSQDDERAGFASHAGLLAQCRSNSPPVLFHKAGLQEYSDSVLASEIRKEIGSSQRRVVGVVVNAVDDSLLKGEQIDTRWSRDEIKVLPALLHEARMARRLVILISDHGHVLDCQAAGRPGSAELAGGERWRAAGGSLAADELQVSGSRVLAAGHRLIAPWSERVRYGIKKNGYHGGLTPQEMIVPIAVLSSTEEFPTGWTEQPIDVPAWWDTTAPSARTPEQPAPKLKPVPQAKGTLFNLEEDEPPVEVPGAQVPSWVARLLTCPVFADQKRLGGRGVPDDDMFAKLLTALDQRGGKLTSVALTRELEFPPLRLTGLLAKAERVLNVDGYDVLRRNDASDTIELNRELLLKQFDLVE